MSFECFFVYPLLFIYLYIIFLSYHYIFNELECMFFVYLYLSIQDFFFVLIAIEGITPNCCVILLLSFATKLHGFFYDKKLVKKKKNDLLSKTI